MELERRNAYFCKKCRKVTITVDVDEGVTPMFNPCVHCGEMASSFMYQIPGSMRFDFSTSPFSVIPADLEWYKPNEKETLLLSKSEAEHVFKGGLLCRKRTSKPAIMQKVK